MKQNQNKKPNGRSKTRQPRKDSRAKRVNYDNARDSKFDRDVEDKVSCDKSNDVAWYAKNPEMFKSAGSIGFVNVAGKEMPWSTEVAVPGVMTLAWIPSLGGGDQTAVNQAANSIYSFVVHANSRNQSYDAPDLMMMILAGASLFSTISHGLRAYGTMRRFDGMNQYTPKALLSAMGFDYNDLKDNLANMWFDLNHLITQTSQIWIPNDIPLVERWYWMNNNIYMDGESVKAQYYMYVPDLIYQLSETGSEHGTSLIDAPRPSEPTKHASFVNGAPWKWREYVQFVQQLLDALIGSQDRGIIMGDILKAYGADHVYALTSITSEYVTEPVYNQEVLTQIENATMWPHRAASITQSQITRMITQNFEDMTVPVPTANNQSTYAKAFEAMLPGTGVLNFHFKGQPTPEQIMVATRMMILGLAVDEVSDQGLGSIYPMYTGSEYCSDVIAWQYDYSQNTPVPVLKTEKMSTWNGAEETVDGVKYYMKGMPMPYSGKPRFVAMWTAFDWAPAIYFLTLPSEVTATTLAALMKNSVPYNVLTEYDNYAIVSTNEIRKLHVAALLSEFGVPKI